MDDYSQIMFATQDDRQRWCKVSIKKKPKRNWVGVMLYQPNALPIWFAYNKKTRQRKHSRKFDAIWMLLPQLHYHVITGVERSFIMEGYGY